MKCYFETTTSKIISYQHSPSPLLSLIENLTHLHWVYISLELLKTLWKKRFGKLCIIIQIFRMTWKLYFWVHIPYSFKSNRSKWAYGGLKLFLIMKIHASDLSNNELYGSKMEYDWWKLLVYLTIYSKNGDFCKNFKL